MTAKPIAYDKPVKNLIAGLDATGHVTNTAYRKSSVTFHHNGGRLSHEGVLEVWKTREASAHFDVDGTGDVAQYVGVNMYAWATGNTEGNKSSISIELANATLAPDYTVAEVTWRSGARLAGWLFARVIGEAPTRDTVHFHHDWKSTLCAGPYMDKVREQVFQEVLAAYQSFVSGSATPASSAPPAASAAPWGAGKTVEVVAREVMAGTWGNGVDRVNRLKTAGYDPDLVQDTVNALTKGLPVPAAPAPAAPVLKSVDEIASEVIAGNWGNGPERSRRLQAAGYNVTDVQNAVNTRLGSGNKAAPVRLSVNALAQQVIAQQWGNGPERQRRIVAAGYDYAAVQAEVNRLLKK